MSRRTWTEEEVDILASFSNDPEGDTVKGIADYLGRTQDSIHGKLYRMRRESDYVELSQRRWTKREDSAVINSKGRLTHEELAEQLNRSKSAVTHRAIFLGVAKKKVSFTDIGKDIQKLAAEGYTRKEIAGKLSLEYTQVRNYIYRNKIDCKSSKEVLK